VADLDDKNSEEAKKLLISAEMNKLVYKELILSIDNKISSKKVEFNLATGFKAKEYVNGNAFMTYEQLKNKLEPLSAPSLVSMEKNPVNPLQRRGKIQIFG
jgi:hypothetical protein